MQDRSDPGSRGGSPVGAIRLWSVVDPGFTNGGGKGQGAAGTRIEAPQTARGGCGEGVSSPLGRGLERERCPSQKNFFDFGSQVVTRCILGTIFTV